MAVSMREISALKEERVVADTLYDRPQVQPIDKKRLQQLAENALYFSFIMTYAQGMHQLSEASKEYRYELNMALIAKIWRAGCIIRARLLADITKAFEADNSIPNLLLSPSFVNEVQSTVTATRELAAYAAMNGIPLPGITSALTYFDAFTATRLPLNLIQAQRDYFGSHTYERLDREGIFHTDWES